MTSLKNELKLVFLAIILLVILTTSLLLPSLFSPNIHFIPLKTVQTDVVERWTEYAEIAWRYYSPWKGWNPDTGLPWTNPYYHLLNGWDLGAYITAIINAEKLGVITPAEADSRLDKVIDFLENRNLTPNGIPALAYDSDTGEMYGDPPGDSNVSDEGRFLIALHLLKEHKPGWASTIDYIVYTKTNYTRLADSWAAWTSTRDYYAYYVAQGFQLFGFDVYAPVANALQYMEYLLEKERTGEVIDYWGLKLPIAETSMEPLLLGVLDLNLNSLFKKFAFQVYQVQERRYRQEGNLTAWSEGQYDGSEADEYFLYEWIGDRQGRKWRITNTMGEVQSISPVVYTKIAFAMDAIFQTNYSQTLVNELLFHQELMSSYGFLEGINEEGRPLTGPLGNYLNYVSMTNSMILSAAHYAITHINYTLHDFPIPFVSPDGILSSSFILGANVPHGPCDGAYMIDLTAAVPLASALGSNSSFGRVAAYVDDEVADYDSARVYAVKAEGNVITYGSFGVNLVTRYFNDLGDVLPACMKTDETGVYIYVPSTDHRYYMQNDYWHGTNVTDYGMLVLHYDVMSDRYILISAGFSGYSTRATAAYLAEYETYPLDGLAMIIRYYDEQGDGVHEEVAVAEVVSLAS